jgi:hypothetical protein
VTLTFQLQTVSYAQIGGTFEKGFGAWGQGCDRLLFCAAEAACF